MTSAEHFREAEQLLRRAQDPTYRGLHKEIGQLLATAQVHATLALAAAGDKEGATMTKT